MQETNSLNQVAEFHSTFKHPILESPVIPSKQRANLRISLLAEELKELQEAVENDDLVEVADALCDLQYVLAGAIHEFGLGGKFKTLFDEVHRSNMSKACKTIEEAEQTIQFYLDKDEQNRTTKKLTVCFSFSRKSDDKTLKSINYSPADLKGLLG